jgi:glycosyltransferase involved in cell wall biosynthesis
VLDRHPGARLVFYGNGEERQAMQDRARQLGINSSVEFHGPIPPADLSDVFAGATASVASLAPVPPNDYALATKVYSSLAAGCPVIYAGRGPTVDFVNDAEHPLAGVAVGYDVDAVVRAMLSAAENPLPPSEREALAEWSARRFSLDAIAEQVVRESLALVSR